MAEQEGYMITAATGEPQAFRTTRAGALVAIEDVEAYWAEAERCGHPDAPGYVAKLRPFVAVPVTAEEHAMLIAEYGTPIIDREP